MKALFPLFLILFAGCSGSEAKPFTGAGVLPYCIHDGQVWVALGFDPDKSAWTDFGGGPEKVVSLQSPQPRWETQQETATRECSEETRYLISRNIIKAGLSDSRYFDHPKVSYRIYTLMIAYFPPRDFETEPIPAGKQWEPAREKKGFFWIPLETLKQAVLEAEDPGNINLPGTTGEQVLLFPPLHDSLYLVFSRGADLELFPAETTE